MCGYPHWRSRRDRWYLAQDKRTLKEVSRALMTIRVHMNGWHLPAAGTFTRAALLAL
jgi:hypothetical protein